MVYKSATVRQLLLAMLIALCGAYSHASGGSYLFMWAGDAAGKASDFLAVIDASPASARYGAVIASLPTGAAGTHPHHTEHEMPANGHLLANGFHAGRTWLFDLSKPAASAHHHVVRRRGWLQPPALVHQARQRPCIDDVPVSGAARGQPSGSGHDTTRQTVDRSTGVSWRWTNEGRPIRIGSASDAAIKDTRIYPYSVLPLPAFDLAVSTTTDMDEANKAATSEWVQFWQLSNLKLLRSIALPPGPRGDEHQFTGEPRLLPDGQERLHPHVQLRPVPASRRRTSRADSELRDGVQGEELRSACPDRSVLDCRRCRTRTRSLPSTSRILNAHGRSRRSPSAKTSSRTGSRSTRRAGESC